MNLASIIIGIILLAIIVWAAVKSWKNRGKCSGCSGSCSACRHRAADKENKN